MQVIVIYEVPIKDPQYKNQVICPRRLVISVQKSVFIFGLAFGLVKFNERLGIKHLHTTAYHPQTNVAVERVSKTIVSLIRISLMALGERKLGRSFSICDLRMPRGEALVNRIFTFLFTRILGNPVKYLSQAQLDRLARIRAQALRNIRKYQL